jgi:iron complex outermembrane recepter protein
MEKQMSNKTLLAGAICLAIAQLAVPALAQQTGEDTAAPDAKPDQAVPSKSVRTLGKVQVTAQRRVENVQKTSVAISAVDGEQIEQRGLASIGDVLSQTPGVVVQGAAKGASIFIRGVGSTGDAQQGGDPAVSLNIDGVYQQQQSTPLAATLDVERVEVLRGPQGTLYGRNSNAGSINVITREPTLGGGEGHLRVDVGNYNSLRTEAAGDLPINAVSAARVAFASSRHDGYLSSGANAEDSTTARVKYLLQPSDELKLRVTAEHSRETGTPTGTVDLPHDTAHPWHSDLPSGYQDVKNTRIYAQLDYTTPIGVLTVLPSFSKTYQYNDTKLLPLFANAIEITEYARQLDARLVSLADSPVKWVTGVYYYASENHNNPFAPVRLTSEEHLSVSAGDAVMTNSLSRTYAAYGQASFPVGDSGLRLVAGARYTVDRKGFDYGLATSSSTYTAGYMSLFDNWKAFTYKVGFEKDLAENSFLYGNVSSGLKAGGINVENYSKYDPEKITAVEIGSKNRFLDNTLQINGTLFYYDYTNYQAQVPYVDASSPGGFGFEIENAATAKIYGAELETSWAPATSDRIDLNLSYLHARYGDFVYTNSSGTVDRTGRTPPNAPTWSGLVSYQHFWDLASGANVTARLDVRYSSTYDSSIDIIEHDWDVQKSFSRSDFSLMYTPSSQRWNLRAYVRNIENKAQLIFAQAPLSSVYAAMVSAPRTFGLSATVRF